MPLTGNNPRETIRSVILGMERPFNVSDLLYILAKYYNINDRSLILDILDELCDSNQIDYSEINDDCWAFNVIQFA